jgi:predicted GIY-YIG superfamily endonuclease
VTNQHTLYRFFDADDVLLYVGITLNPAARWPRHKRDKPWWYEVRTITTELHPSREAVLQAEQAAIKAEEPRYNVIHNENAARIAPGVDHQFKWTCLFCNFPIPNGKGSIWVTEADHERFQQEEQKVREIQRQRNASELPWYELFAWPAEWITTHHACDTDDEAKLWEIQIEDVRTPMLVLTATVNLISKPWINGTGWANVLLELADGTD